MSSNRALWAKRVERWKDSGLTAKEFAAEVGINASTLTYWKWRLGKEEREGQGAKSNRRPKHRSRKTASVDATRGLEAARSAPPLVEVQLAAPAEVPFEVELPDGRRVRVPVTFEEDALRRLLAVLQEAA